MIRDRHPLGSRAGSALFSDALNIGRIIALLVITAVLGLQIAAFEPALLGLGKHDVYPFLDYPMYSSLYRHDVIETLQSDIRVETRSGENLSADLRWGDEYGMGLNQFRARYLRPLLKGNDDAARDLARRLALGRPEDPVVHIAVFERQVRLAPEGLLAGPPVEFVYDVEPTDTP